MRKGKENGTLQQQPEQPATQPAAATKEQQAPAVPPQGARTLSNDINATNPPTSFGGAVPQSGFNAWIEAAKKPAASAAQEQQPEQPATPPAATPTGQQQSPTAEREKTLSNDINATKQPTSFGGAVPRSGFNAWLDAAKQPAATPTTPTTPTEQPAAPTYSSMDDFIREVEAHTESDAERRARERREKRRQMINGIADMGRAIANLYYTNQGSPNAYDHDKNSLSEAYQKRLDKAKADRDKNRDWWTKWALTKANLKRQDIAAENAAEQTALTQAQSAQAYKDSREDAAAKLKLLQEELELKKKEQEEKSQARAEMNQAKIKALEAKEAGETKKAEYWEAKEKEAYARMTGDYTRAEYYKAKAEEIRNGTTTTTTKTVDDPLKGKVTTQQTVSKTPNGGQKQTQTKRKSKTSV